MFLNYAISNKYSMDWGMESQIRDAGVYQLLFKTDLKFLFPLLPSKREL